MGGLFCTTTPFLSVLSLLSCTEAALWNDAFFLWIMSKMIVSETFNSRLHRLSMLHVVWRHVYITLDHFLHHSSKSVTTADARLFNRSKDLVCSGLWKACFYALHMLNRGSHFSLCSLWIIYLLSQLCCYAEAWDQANLPVHAQSGVLRQACIIYTCTET